MSEFGVYSLCSFLSLTWVQKTPPSASSLLPQSQAKLHICSKNINNYKSNLSLLLNHVPQRSDSVVRPQWLGSHTLHQI